MISKDSRKHLIELCDRFINTGNDVTQPTIIRSSVNFNISQYIKFEDPKLSVLITNVDTDGPHRLRELPVSKLSLLGILESGT